MSRVVPKISDSWPRGPRTGFVALELLEAVRESAVHGRSVTLPVHGPAEVAAMPSARPRIPGEESAW